MNNENQLVVEDKDTDKDKGKKRDKKDIVKNIAIVFLCIMLALTFFSNTIMNYSLAQVATVSVDSGEIVKEIPISGEIVAEDPYEVTVKESRKISGVAVKEGAHVKKDDILFYLDDIESEEFLAEKDKFILDFVSRKNNYTFATESSRGIRAEGMTTLSRNLDASPTKSPPGRLLFFAPC